MTLRIRYSLRTFLVLLAVVPAAVGVWIRRSSEQSQIVRRLEGFGLSVAYDLDVQEGGGLLARCRQALASRFGKDLVAVPVSIKPGGNASIYNDDLQMLVKLRWLHSLELNSHGTDDESLAIIARLPRLKNLKISNGLITDAGLPALGRCRSLEEIRLLYTHVTDAAVAKFAAAHPACRIQREGPPRTYRLSKEYTTFPSPQRPDRVLLSWEQEQLDAALRIFHEPDMLVRYHLVQIVDLYEPPTAKELEEDPEFAKVLADIQDNLEDYVAGLGSDFGFREAIERLKILGHADGIPALARIVQDTSAGHDHRCGAIAALARIADRRVVPILIDLLEDEKQSIAVRAWQYLHEITGKPKDENLMWTEKWNMTDGRNSPAAAELAAHWRQFWKEKGEFFRPRHVRDLL